MAGTYYLHNIVNGGGQECPPTRVLIRPRSEGNLFRLGGLSQADRIEIELQHRRGHDE